MLFYVYENWVAEKKAVIHKSDCGFCNSGKGCHENPLGDKCGKWHGSFNTFEKAKDFALSLKNRKMKIHSCAKLKEKKTYEEIFGDLR